MKKLVSMMAFGLVAFGVGCPSGEAYCTKLYDCEEELGVDYEDDFPAVCNASFTGAQAALRENAEQECEDLANAQAAHVSCKAGLECEDLKKAEGDLEADTICKETGKALKEAIENADVKCDAVAD